MKATFELALKGFHSVKAKGGWRLEKALELK